MWGLIAGIIIADQILKIWVKTHMHMGEDILLEITVEQSEEKPVRAGEIARMIFSGEMLFYIVVIGIPLNIGVMLCVTLITAGAMGNLIDCCFYGLIFNESSYSVAQLFPPEGGYAPFLQGKVVDMFYFPLFETELPGWLPFWGGDHFEFFSAIFNIADAAITVGTIWLIIDQMFFSPKNSKKEEENASENPEKSEKVVA